MVELDCVAMAVTDCVVKSEPSIQNVPPGPSVTPVKITAATPNAKETVPNPMLQMFTPFREALAATTVADAVLIVTLVGVVPVED